MNLSGDQIVFTFDKEDELMAQKHQGAIYLDNIT
jgi:hypothetical protein